MSSPSAPTTTPSAVRSPATVLVAVLAFAGIVVSLMQTLVIPLIPQLPRLLNASAADTTWAITATLLAGAVATPTVGRLADMLGKRRMLMVCLIVLVAGSVIAALSTTLVPMVIGRALQGLAAGVVPLGISLMRDQLPPERLGSATALMSASLGVGGALGLPIASLVAQYADWHVLFWAAAGMGTIATVLVLTLIPESPQRAGGRFDLVGAVGLSVTLVCLLLAISKGGTWGWTSGVTLGLFTVAVVALAAWGWWELRAPHPLVDLRISRRRQVLLTNSASAVFGFSMFAMSLVLPQLLQLPTATGYGLGQSILAAGLVLAPGGLVMMAMSPVSARITAGPGPRTTLMLGALVVAIGYGLGVVLHATIWQLLLMSVFISAGIGLAYGAMPALVMAAVPVTQTAAANSLNNLMRALGTSIASAVAGVVLAQMTIAFGPAAVPTENAFRVVLGLGAGAALAALAIASFIPRRRPAATPTPAPTAPLHDLHVPPRVEADDRERSVVPLVHGVVRRGEQPAHGAVLTVVDTTGRQLGHARTDADGRYRITRHGADGRAYLLIVQWAGISRAEYLLHTGRLHRHDIDLDTPPGQGPRAEPLHVSLAEKPRRHEDAEATT
ncbi:MAG: bmr5 [Pseudonocardia sp.]|jgi:EmrB/QacA subfamily drug resistance transporter|nr:bmr5 [Pseudonocardia sp.]